MGYIVFPGLAALDVFGPLNALFTVSNRNPMSLSILSMTPEPVSIGRTVINGTQVPAGSISPDFMQLLPPTHTLAEVDAAGMKFDVIVVPGGGGTRQIEYTQPIVDWIAARAKDPDLSYLMTVCTGATLTARSGVMAGKNATSNKAAWNWVKSVPGADKVNWIAKARWVVDGNLWTSSGVSAGTDMMLAWIEHVYGHEEMIIARNSLEWNQLGEHDDPYAEIYGLE